MTLKELKIGTRLELEVQGRDEKSRRTYVSQLLEPVNGNRFMIAAPIYEARLIYIPTDFKIRVIFNNPREGLFGIMAYVRAKEMRGNIAVLQMEVAGEVEKIQRRGYYRLECLLETEYSILEAADGKVISEVVEKKAFTQNLSGSGACFIVEESISRNAVLKAVIYLETGMVTVVCSVIRCTEIESKKMKKFKVGVHFTEISPKDRDQIIKYVFHQQRLLFKKEQPSK